MKTTSRYILVALASALALYISGCNSTDCKSALLYRKDSSPPGEQWKRTTANTTGGVFNGNVVRVPRGRLAQFDLEEIKIGWLAENQRKSGGFPSRRLLPEKALWLVIQIEGFKSDDFLRTSSKRSFKASAVKQNQNSTGYVPLDDSETRFALMTAEFQYEVTFTIYSVDNFKLKQVLGYVAKDNPGLVKIGVDAVKQMGGAAVDFVADPFNRAFKHQFGSDFLFERILLTAGAVTEFEGTIYVIGEGDPRPDNADQTTVGTFVLADLSEVKESTIGARMGELQRHTGPETNHNVVGGYSYRTDGFRTAYASTLSAMTESVTGKHLSDPAANVIKFSLVANPDKNRQAAEQSGQLRVVETGIKNEQTRLASQTDAYLERFVSPLERRLLSIQENSSLATGRIARTLGPRLNAAAEFMIKFPSGGPADTMRADPVTTSVRTAFDQPETATVNELLPLMQGTLELAGLKYLGGTALPLVIDENGSSPRVNVGVFRDSSALRPKDVMQRLESVSTTAKNLAERLEEYVREVRKVTNQGDKGQFKAAVGEAALTALQEEMIKQAKALLPEVRDILLQPINSHFNREASTEIADFQATFIRYTDLQDAKRREIRAGTGPTVTIF